MWICADAEEEKNEISENVIDAMIEPSEEVATKEGDAAEGTVTEDTTKPVSADSSTVPSEGTETGWWLLIRLY